MKVTLQSLSFRFVRVILVYAMPMSRLHIFSQLQICATQRHWLHGGVDRSTQYVGVDNSNHTMLTNTDLATDFMIQTKFEW